MYRYKKTSFLGEGSFGLVYKAGHKNTGKQVALKKFRISDEEYGLPINAIREITSMRKICGDHVVKLLDCFIHKGNLIIVLEFMDRKSLEDLIYDKSISLKLGDIKAYMSMTLSALLSVHKECFVHRDIKPNNLLLSHSGVLKLADFGSARTIGTPGLNHS